MNIFKKKFIKNINIKANKMNLCKLLGYLFKNNLDNLK